MADKIQMWELTQSQYNNLETKDPYTFYKTFDNNVYLGEILLSNDEVVPSSDDTPAYMQWAVKQGIAQDLWSVGDSFPIELSGTFPGCFDENGELYQIKAKDSKKMELSAIIIGFDHNASLETNNKHSITLQFGICKNIDNCTADEIKELEDNNNFVPITFSQNLSRDDGSDPYEGFQMNLTNINVGGWESCYMRNSWCPRFFEWLPSDWQKVVSTVTKYQDNTGNFSNTDAGIWNTDEQIFLLAEYEIFGSRTYANQYEQNYQQQYDYYKGGDEEQNRKLVYELDYYFLEMENPLGTFASDPDNWYGGTCPWWSRSASYNASNSFCLVDSGGPTGYSTANASLGLAPAFVISEESDVTAPQ